MSWWPRIRDLWLNGRLDEHFFSRVNMSEYSREILIHIENGAGTQAELMAIMHPEGGRENVGKLLRAVADLLKWRSVKVEGGRWVVR